MKKFAREFGFRFEWTPEHLWVGILWKREDDDPEGDLDVWICLVPCFPLHLWWRRKHWSLCAVAGCLNRSDLYDYVHHKWLCRKHFFDDAPAGDKQL